MRILFAGGGTAGHINPAVAVANFIKEKEPDCEILFVGTEDGMESNLVPRQGYEIRFIKIHGFERKLSVKNIRTAAEIVSSISAAKKIIKEFRPDVVMGTGGYVTGPVLFAACQMNIPTLVHEANAYPGVTVRILARFVDVVALAMEKAREYLPASKRVEITGNPVRPSILKCNPDDARKKLMLDERKVILVFGGSLGAAGINKVVTEWISNEPDIEKYQIILSAGKNHQYDQVLNEFGKHGFDLEKHTNVKVYEYIYDMDLALNAADLIIARSGGSVSEMTALGKPAILIPSPYVAGNHQEHNARAVEAAGGAVVITESELSAEIIGKNVSKILNDSKTLADMCKGARKIGITDATNKLYGILKELIDKK